jgi:hypothetical protein
MAVARAQWIAGIVMITLLVTLVPPLAAMGAAIASTAAAATVLVLMLHSLARTAPAAEPDAATAELTGRTR